LYEERLLRLLSLRPEVDLSEGRKKVFAILVLSVLILAAYSNTFHATWQFDDEPNILQRSALHLTELRWSEIKKTFVNEKGAIYRPVACFSLALNYYYGKDRVFGYHLVNIFIHVLTSIFLFLFIYQGLNLPVLALKYAPHRYAIALLSTTLWALNPIQTQAVTYIVQRMASMAGMFYVLVMFLYLKARMAKGLQNRVLLFTACAIAGLLAIGSKENAFMIPVSLYLFEILLLRGLSNDNRMKQLKILTAVLFISLGLCLLFFLLLRGGIDFSGYEKRVFTLKERLLSEPRIILFYITLIFYPMPDRLSVAHDIPVSSSLFDPPTTLLSILLVTGILFTAVRISRKYPFVSFSLVFFFLNHLIESSFLPLELVFEHRNYIPSMFLFVPVALLLWHGITSQHLKRWIRALVSLFVVCLIVAFGHGTFVRNSIWKSQETLWLNATEVAPALWRPWHNLGRYYADNQAHDKALTLYSQALSKRLSINKTDKKLTYYNIGHEYQALGQKDKALFYYQEAARIDPTFAPPLTNKAVLLSERGEIKEAIQEYMEAIRYKENLPEPYINLGYLYLRTGQIDEAIKILEKSLTLNPDSAIARKGLACGYRRKGLFGKAYLTYQTALALEPKDLSPLLYLAEIYGTKGMETQKERAMERFVRFLPELELRDLIQDLTSEDAEDYTLLIDRNVAVDLLSEALGKKADSLKKMVKELE